MKILVTGAGGNSNQILVPMLIDAGHTVVALDVRSLDYQCKCVRVSVLDELGLAKAAIGADLIVHAAGCADHSLPRGPEVTDGYPMWWEMSALSTHHLYRAALEARVPKVVCISSREYYAVDGAPGVMDEDYDVARPAHNYYAMSKVISEDIVRYYAARHGIASIVLRPGNFTGLPEPGPEFLSNRLRREDVAQAEFLCLDHEPEGGFEAFNVFAGNPFGPADLADLQEHPMEAIERYYPGAKALMEVAGAVWGGMTCIPSIARARDRLGYRPQFTFEGFLEKLGWEAAV